MTNSVGTTEAGGDNISPSSYSGKHLIHKPVVRITALFLGIAVSCLLVYKSDYPFQFLPSSFRFTSGSSLAFLQENSPRIIDPKLARVLTEASMADKTVILTTLNEAWAEPQSILDIFLESFKIGKNTQRYLNHLVIITLDQKAHNRCLALHPHCYALNTTGLDFEHEAYYMTHVYLEMMWRRIDFLASVLELGYNFVFTDADIVWLQDPFPQFDRDADFQISCDRYNGNPRSRKNEPNGGFNYAKSNNRTIWFYRFWYSSRNTYPGLHDQDVLNKIKYDRFLYKIGLRMRFLDTAYFGGFCQHGKDFNKVCTMHANCCFGMDNKVHDLKLVLEDWKRFTSLPPSKKPLRSPSWRAPQNCSIAHYHPPEQ